MNIVVCVKYVPDSEATRSFEPDHTVDRAGAEGRLNELDEYAVEQALRLKEKDPAQTQVTAVTIGPEQAEAAIRRALQMGADSGVHVTDPGIAGSDALATSLLLAEAVKTVNADLVVCGIGSTDAGMSVVPAMLAERLAIPQVTFANSVQLDGSRLSVLREDDSGTHAAEAPLPLVVSVTDRSGEPRYPSFKGITSAKKKPVLRLSLADLGVDSSAVGLSAAATQVASVTTRPLRIQGEVVSDEDGTGAKALVEFLASRKIV